MKSDKNVIKKQDDSHLDLLKHEYRERGGNCV